MLVVLAFALVPLAAAANCSVDNCMLLLGSYQSYDSSYYCPCSTQSCDCGGNLPLNYNATATFNLGYGGKAVFAGGLVYYFGGYNEQQCGSSNCLRPNITVYDPCAKRLTYLPATVDSNATTYYAANHTATLLGDVIFVCGGMHATGSGVSPLKCRIFELISMSFIEDAVVPVLVQAVQHAAAVAFENKLFIIGGVWGPTTMPSQISNMVQYYKASSKQSNFTIAGVDQMPNATANAAVAPIAMAGGQMMLVCGGIVSVNGTLAVSSDCYTFDPNAAPGTQWQLQNNLKLLTPRHSATIITNFGNTYIVGGSSTVYADTPVYRVDYLQYGNDLQWAPMSNCPNVSSDAIGAAIVLATVD